MVIGGWLGCTEEHFFYQATGITFFDIAFLIVIV
jgi:hypothetical protein